MHRGTGSGEGERKGWYPSIRLFIRPFKGIDNQDVK